jgi:hypothetical protein
MVIHIEDTNITALYPDSTTRILKIENILYSLELNCSLISWRCLKLKGFKTTLGEECFIY